MFSFGCTWHRQRLEFSEQAADKQGRLQFTRALCSWCIALSTVCQQSKQCPEDSERTNTTTTNSRSRSASRSRMSDVYVHEQQSGLVHHQCPALPRSNLTRTRLQHLHHNTMGSSTSQAYKLLCLPPCGFLPVSTLTHCKPVLQSRRSNPKNHNKITFFQCPPSPSPRTQ